MIASVVRFSLRHRGVVFGLALVTVGYGLYVGWGARLEVFPEFTPSQVIVQTEAPGLGPEEVESLVTRPVESAVNGTLNLRAIRSRSIQGLSVITAVFEDGTPWREARRAVGERLAEVAGEMPAGVKPPFMAAQTSATSTVLTVGLTSASRTLMELRTFADWTLRPKLLSLPGVAKVAIYGGEVRQLQIQVLPDRLAAFHLDITDVAEAARASTGLRGGGFIDTPGQRISIRTEGQSLLPETLAEIPLDRADSPRIRLGDVARVREAPEPRIGAGVIDGEPGVILVIWSQPRANTMQVTDTIEAALERMRGEFEARGIVFHGGLFRAADFISSSISNVRSSLLAGGALVAVVLFLFLFNLRTAFISLTAIPLSLLAAVLVLTWSGATLNTLTLGGLAIAIGEVVDDAIIDVENIYRRLKENARSKLRIVFDASLEVRTAVVYATFVVALVFLPVLFMSGVSGRLFAPLAVAYILATVASLVVALTVTPALAAALLIREGTAPEPPWIEPLKRAYGRLLGSIIGRPRNVTAAALLLALAAGFVVKDFGSELLPELKEGHFIVHASALTGTSLDESTRVSKIMGAKLRADKRIRSVATQIGRAERGDDTWGTHYSESEVDLVPRSGEEVEAVQRDLRLALHQFPGLYFSVNSFLTERIEETVTGSPAAVVVKLFGVDMDVLDRRASEVLGVLRNIEGVRDAQVTTLAEAPFVVVRLRPERLRQFSVAPVRALDAVQAAYQGAAAAQVHQGNQVYDVVVLLDPSVRGSLEDIGRLFVKSSYGVRTPLGALADIYQANGRSEIRHEGARRFQEVTCNVRGRDVGSFVAEATKKLADLGDLGDYRVEGAAEEEQAARKEILRYSLVAAVGIVLLLGMVFRSAANLALVLTNLPMALIGGALAVYATGGVLSIGSLVGFVTLFGITTRNSIMMISHFEHLTTVEGLPWGRETAIRGAAERLRPILMTALVTGLGLLPIAVGGGEAGREIEGPMAVVILGGLASSTGLNLLVLPTLALALGKFRKLEEEL